MNIEVTSQNILSQDLLRRLEALCIQEEPPACMAACPLHVDVRALCKAVAAGNLKAAFAQYQKAVPFARLVALTCDAPCEGVCLREELGGAVQIQQLERAIAPFGTAAKPPLLLPKKEGRVAVVGGGLRGMTAANDLARKGYAVTIYERSDALGGRLRDLPGEMLPRRVLEEEIDGLLKLGVAVERGHEVHMATAADAAALLAEVDVALVACESPLGALADGETLLVPGFDRLVAGRRAGRLTGVRESPGRTEGSSAPAATPPMRAKGQPAGDSSVYDVFDGRSAATTADRLLQGVSVEAGREKEGSGPTALYVNLAGIGAEAAAPPSPGGYTADEAAAEAARCIQCECMECVKRCGFLQHYGRYPRKYVREVYNNLSIAMGNHDANAMINRCALCGQCGAVCPNGLDMGAVFKAARQRMTLTGKMPQSAFEFALLDMDYSLGNAFHLARHAPGKDTSSALFFPGCQLAASEPELVEAVYADLRGKLGDVGLLLSCCGVMAHWAGDEPRFAAAGEQLRADWAALGRPRVIAACPSCAKTLNELHGIPTAYIGEALEVDSAQNPTRTMVLHNACGARFDGEMQASVRRLAASCGVEVAKAREETQSAFSALAAGDVISSRRTTCEGSPCCGYGGLAPFVDAGVAGEITAVALEQLGGTGADPGRTEGSSAPAAAGTTDAERQPAGVLTYCVNCRDRFLAAGRESFHILELCYPHAPLRRQPPGWSTRQENRAALRRRLLKDIWGEAPKEVPGMELFMTPETEEKLEADCILRSDLAAAIAHAEASGEKLVDTATGHITANYRPGNVTFWVEYAPEGTAENGGGYRVHKAYSHRMQAVVTGRQREEGGNG